ncbi:MAG: hypothetical protein ACYC1E_01630 [Propionibacteriaceae bacterium]
MTGILAPGTGVRSNAYEAWKAASRPGKLGSSTPYVRSKESGDGQPSWSSTVVGEGNARTYGRRRAATAELVVHGRRRGERPRVDVDDVAEAVRAEGHDVGDGHAAPLSER